MASFRKITITGPRALLAGETDLETDIGRAVDPNRLWPTPVDA